MATYTTNYNLKKPDNTDPFGDFRGDYNDNLDIIDANLGGGGGSGGHTIIDENDTPMTQRTGLQFTGNVSVSDDAVNDKTVVDIKGGNVYGFAIDESRKLFEGTMTNFTQTLEYTATEDAIALVDYYGSNGTNQWIVINGVSIPFAVLSSGRESFALPIRKGDTIAGRHSSDNESCYFHLACYGIKQGTNGIFAPVIYSDNERVIGVWRDNKPLYQKTLVANNLNLDTSGTPIDITSLGVEMCTPIYGGSYYIVSGVKRGFAKLEYQQPNEVYLYPAINRSNTTCYVTIQYTKTTDVAGSGNWNTDGVPTVHYSTSEQVIGTYLGKPLYQRTWDIPTITVSNVGAWISTSIDASIMASLVDVKTSDNNVVWSGISAVIDGGIIKLINTTSQANLGVSKITLQYTKTTD